MSSLGFLVMRAAGAHLTPAESDVLGDTPPPSGAAWALCSEHMHERTYQGGAQIGDVYVIVDERDCEDCHDRRTAG